ncbi:MAG: hypothetical protein J2P24_17130 [Streptosporangiales bacterium]|nr:hypothetical protein [Streptosporangiales bacterium]MBO0891776.1 hypothetical protein [Acidothermales bacterium]
MNTLTIAELARQHREDLLTEAAEYHEYRETTPVRRGIVRRLHRRSPTAPHAGRPPANPSRVRRSDA